MLLTYLLMKFYSYCKIMNLLIFKPTTSSASCKREDITKGVNMKISKY